MKVGRHVRRGLRLGRRWWWQQARPSTGATLAGSGEARPLADAGRPPTPQERWLPSTPTTGPWAGADPHAAGRWARPTSLAMLAVWAGAVGLRVRRDVRRTRQD